MIGQQIGPYSILNLIGRGDIGTVYQAVHSASEQLVAIKALSRELSANPATRDRILSQANQQAGLFHPNVVNILKYIKDRQEIYLVMEYVRGESLEKQLTRVGCLEPSEAIRIALKILEAMAFMHKRGIYHRHLKPSDILIAGDGNIKVMDFGIAKVFGEKGISLTGMRLESLWYMSPEQLRGETITAASDIYSLGITLYQMLTGEVPFHGKSRFEVMKAHMEELPRDPAATAPELPRGVCDLVLKALAKNPQDRFQSAKAFADALLRSTDPGAPIPTLLAEGDPLYRENGSGEPEAFSETCEVSSSGISEEALHFPDHFNRKILFLLIGGGMVLTGLLIHLLFFGESRKDDRIKYRIPANLSPVDRTPSPPAFPMTSGHETMVPEAVSSAEIKTESAPAGIDRRLLTTPPFPQAPVAPWEAEIPMLPQPGSTSPAISDPGASPKTASPDIREGENPIRGDAAFDKVDTVRQENGPSSEVQPKKGTKPSGKRRSSQKPDQQSGRGTHGWRIIK